MISADDCPMLCRFARATALVIAVALSPLAWSASITCKPPFNHPGTVIPNFGELGTWKYHIDTTYPTPSEILKICDVSGSVVAGTKIKIVEEITNIGTVPWHDWESTLTSPQTGIKIGLMPSLTDNLGNLMAGVFSISNGGTSGAQASNDMLSVVFGTEIGPGGSFVLTQFIELPFSVGLGYSFGMTESPSVAEPAMLWLLASAGLAWMAQRRQPFPKS